MMKFLVVFVEATLLDLTTTDASLKKFSAAFTDGTDGILVGWLDRWDR